MRTHSGSLSAIAAQSAITSNCKQASGPDVYKQQAAGLFHAHNKKRLKSRSCAEAVDTAVVTQGLDVLESAMDHHDTMKYDEDLPRHMTYHEYIEIGDDMTNHYHHAR